MPFNGGYGGGMMPMGMNNGMGGGQELMPMNGGGMQPFDGSPYNNPFVNGGPGGKK